VHNRATRPPPEASAASGVPRPEARSYPTVAPYRHELGRLLRWLLPTVMSFKAFAYALGRDPAME
jgi:hypothetical protein